ncbi:MAG: hypothetical protein BM485_05280 [Desulfobulbaceae bacterium DB1]|nr:MAG: hypothetical protein BM485_05280 [Desulfobulbaceae bacterium DB1]
MTTAQPIKIGISACLLGHQVRYNGGHQHDRLLTDTLGQFMEFVPVCPEVECGLGIPRETMRLVGDPATPRLVTSKTGIDHTDRMQSWAVKKIAELEQQGLLGFIFKSKSPSSGMERVRVYGEGASVHHNGVGIFARAFMDHFPLLPVEDDGRLNDIGLRENFIETIFVCRRLREVQAEGKTLGGLVSFHSDHKLQIMAHSVKHYQTMGRLVAEGKKHPVHELFRIYEQQLLEAMRLKPTIKKHVNVLQHMAGYFKKELSSDEKQELGEIIDRYHKTLVPLIVPVTLINHYVRKYKSDYLARQHYLNPHPLELKLRNHA